MESNIPELKNVPRGTILTLEKFVELLLKWNEKINLIGRNTSSLVWQNHVLPSMRLMDCITEDNPVILDVGSGAGFPGVVLSIIKGWGVVLVEKNRKKCTFLREAQKATGANLIIENCSIETIEETKKFSPDILVSRGVTTIRNFLKLVDRFLNSQVKVMLIKGDRCQEEIDESLGQDWQFDYEIKTDTHPSLRAQRGNLSATTDRLPRRFAPRNDVEAMARSTIVILSNFRRV
jgi:16S rRNA (guanine527-N7)-methyltransferase